jgi:hypothetical protein
LAGVLAHKLEKAQAVGKVKLEKQAEQGHQTGEQKYKTRIRREENHWRQPETDWARKTKHIGGKIRSKRRQALLGALI